jgi:hypothetical protein
MRNLALLPLPNKKNKRRTLSRGADKADVEKVTMKQLKFSSTLTALCMLTTVTITNIAFILKATFQNITNQITYPYIALGTISATITIICILAYLKVQARKSP